METQLTYVTPGRHGQPGQGLLDVSQDGNSGTCIRRLAHKLGGVMGEKVVGRKSGRTRKAFGEFERLCRSLHSAQA